MIYNTETLALKMPGGGRPVIPGVQDILIGVLRGMCGGEMWGAMGSWESGETSRKGLIPSRPQ